MTQNNRQPESAQEFWARAQKYVLQLEQLSKIARHLRHVKAADFEISETTYKESKAALDVAQQTCHEASHLRSRIIGDINAIRVLQNLMLPLVDVVIEETGETITPGVNAGYYLCHKRVLCHQNAIRRNLEALAELMGDQFVQLRGDNDLVL